MQLHFKGIKSFFGTFGFIPFFYLLAGVSLYFILYFFGFITTVPNANNMAQWDAGWYYTISREGYNYAWYMSSNSAFFPLYPYIWKLVQSNVVWMAIINFIIFCYGLYVLKKTFTLSAIQTFVYISIPSTIFFILPYSESVFFLACAVFLVGLRKNNFWLIVFGLFISSTARATAMFFVPAIILMELFASEKYISWKAVKNIIIYSTASLTGLLTVVLIQYYQTHEWFAFVKQQMRFWKHRFNLPSAPPFVSYEGDKILWLDGLAFLFGAIAITLAIIFIIKYLRKRKHELFKNRPYWFSVGYIIMVMFYSLFFNHKSGEGHTQLSSINRYLFSTAFFYIFLSTSLKEFAFNIKKAIIFLVICMVAWIFLGFGSPLEFLSKMYDSQHKTTIFFLFLTINVYGIYASSHALYGKYIGILISCLNILLSVITYNQFINGQWIA